MLLAAFRDVLNALSAFCGTWHRRRDLLPHEGRPGWTNSQIFLTLDDLRQLIWCTDQRNISKKRQGRRSGHSALQDGDGTRAGCTMIRKARPYWGSANYRKPKRTTKTLSRSDYGTSNRHETDDGHRDRARNKSTPRNKIPNDGRERVKRCVNCEHFSRDLNTCNQCGVALREDARLFLDPEEVRSVFRNVLDSVTNMGPDFLPMKINLEDGNQPNQFDKSRMEPCESSKSGQSNKLEASSMSSNDGTDLNRDLDEHINVEAEMDENVITIDSDDEQELENEREPYEIEMSDAGTSHIKDEDATDLVNQMQTSDCPPNTNYFVKKCCRCQTYSFDLQKCETCKKRISPRAEIVLYQSISRRKVKSDEWRKAKFHVIQQEKLKVPIPADLCNMDMVNKMIARGGSKNPNKKGLPRKKPKSKKKKSKSKCQSEPGTAATFGNDVKSPAKAKNVMGFVKKRLNKRKSEATSAREGGAKVKKSKINSRGKGTKIKKDVNNNNGG